MLHVTGERKADRHATVLVEQRQVDAKIVGPVEEKQIPEVCLGMVLIRQPAPEKSELLIVVLLPRACFRTVAAIVLRRVPVPVPGYWQ